jgi:MPBQ/MSBQ methyltransferase
MDRDRYLRPDEKQALIDYLRSLYEGAFTEEAIRAHLENHIGDAFAGYTTEVVRPRVPRGARLLDVGSGFGSCVLAAREAGIDAFGVEMAEFEVRFARSRLKELRPRDNPETVYLLGDARRLEIEPSSLDAVTLWNVIEHIEDWQSVMSAAARFLKPGGLAFIICPNYFAWRQEAHYHVPWKPSFLLPRHEASEYLRSLGRNPAYFESSIFYRTNWEVLSLLGELNFEPLELGTIQSRSLSPRNFLQWVLHPIRFIRFYNPFKHSVEIAARKLA